MPLTVSNLNMPEPELTIEQRLVQLCFAGLGRDLLEVLYPYFTERGLVWESAVRSVQRIIRERDEARAALRAEEEASERGHRLTEILSAHCGERGYGECAEQTLRRIIRERDEARAALRVEEELAAEKAGLVIS